MIMVKKQIIIIKSKPVNSHSVEIIVKKAIQIK